MKQQRRILIVGTAGRDFHVFNTLYRTDPDSVVLGFTAADTPDDGAGRYPSSFSGPLYPAGIEILPESELEQLVARLGIEVVDALEQLPQLPGRGHPEQRGGGLLGVVVDPVRDPQRGTLDTSDDGDGRDKCEDWDPFGDEAEL